jgi:hypothetical protein
MYNQIKMLLKVSASDADLHLSRSLFEPLPTPKAVTLSFCLRLKALKLVIDEVASLVEES